VERGDTGARRFSRLSVRWIHAGFGTRLSARA